MARKVAVNNSAIAGLATEDRLSPATAQNQRSTEAHELVEELDEYLTFSHQISVLIVDSALKLCLERKKYLMRV